MAGRDKIVNGKLWISIQIPTKILVSNQADLQIGINILLDVYVMLT